jgi:hypothetical protein
MYIFINPWNFTEPEDMPEIPELSEKGFKIIVGVGIVCVLNLMGCLIYIFCFL